jgi:hypothetical protein
VTLRRVVLRHAAGARLSTESSSTIKDWAAGVIVGSVPAQQAFALET